MKESREEERELLVRKLIRYKYLSKPEVIEAMDAVPRHCFVPEFEESGAYLDNPLPIGHGQTISAPHMVAIMSEAIDVKAHHKVLEIGVGSGYQAAILAEIVEEGRIISVERIPEIAAKAADDLKRLGYGNVKVVVADGSRGYEKEAPYDRIIVTAGAPRIPQPLLAQLKDPGKLLIPVGGRRLQELKLVEKRDGKISTKNLGGCVFVPLMGEEGW